MLLVADYDSPQSKRLVKSAKEAFKLYDFSRGEGKKSIVLLRSGEVVVTFCESWQITSNFEEE